ncbi:bifunctional Cytidyltransferase-like domain/Rossmann-like alpha-beta-alpha sandwich fold/Ethanolamine-phosphate cytidylyltransferase [Babesia duncani]|uniref:ethanolamine-phosphate cytidylyltransferase n=1 Tax=Babesia duncani TaxID=323732 RepID=A0AAD9PNB8_9APIC|nr:bifunctional Cytidyltransferase-like domain/Rossmann-like alpha-beta-alpha sandwich fold/Ethanolamine-phosphate cytidylyltransferase [Babesia duncani]KAK2198059.1 bifunctional Cytidyltransferase-like domain/Rossmann-like alpha-beta-alpha sandwich fold/Ethanolamine-phosphate cytidylyltransferase [Babesia duncani]
MVDFEPESCRKHVDKNTRIYVDGAFDLLHWGHLNALRQSYKLGGELIVGINGDVETFHAKGISPIYNQDERAELVKGCRWVNEVMVGTPYEVNLDFLVNIAKCDYIAHGDDIAIGASGKDAYDEPKKAGKFIFFRRSLGVSTSTTVGRLIDALESDHFSHLSKNSENKLQYGDFEKALQENEEQMINEGIIDDALFSGNNKHDNKNKKSTDVFPYPRFRLSTSLLGEFITPKPKPKGGKIIYVDGSFDVFHVGHLRLLKRAREMGDYLIVGIYDDQTVRTLKGTPFPFSSLMNRALTILGMRYTDDVVLGAPYVPSRTYLENLGITTVVTGKQHDSKMINRDFDPYREARDMDILVEIDSGSDITTSDIIARVSSRMDQITANIRKRCAIEKTRKNIVCSL